AQSELTHPFAPETVREWMKQMPTWLEVPRFNRLKYPLLLHSFETGTEQWKYMSIVVPTQSAANAHSVTPLQKTTGSLITELPHTQRNQSKRVALVTRARCIRDPKLLPSSIFSTAFTGAVQWVVSACWLLLPKVITTVRQLRERSRSFLRRLRSVDFYMRKRNM